MRTMHFRRSQRRNGITTRFTPLIFVMCIDWFDCTRLYTHTDPVYVVRTRYTPHADRPAALGQVIFVYNIPSKPPVDTIISNTRDRHTHTHTTNCYINNNNYIVGSLCLIIILCTYIYIVISPTLNIVISKV